MTQIRVTGSPVAMQRTEGKTVKLTTFIPLKIKKRGGRRVIVRPDSMAPTDTLKPIVPLMATQIPPLLATSNSPTLSAA